MVCSQRRILMIYRSFGSGSAPNSVIRGSLALDVLQYNNSGLKMSVD